MTDAEILQLAHAAMAARRERVVAERSADVLRDQFAAAVKVRDQISQRVWDADAALTALLIAGASE